ncbi:MAG TPA: tetratricopeptide repeat protein [Anaerolineaceae bacterium]
MARTMNLSQMQTIQAGGLGTLLDKLDVLISRIGSGSGIKAFEILHLLDAIAIQMEEMQEQGANTQAAQAQFDTACAVLRKQAAAFVREVGGGKGVREEREKQRSPRLEWWWRLDEIAAQKRKASLVRALKWTAALVILLAVLVTAYQLFLAPPSEVIARYEAIQKAGDLAVSGNYTQALAAIQKGLKAMPGDPDMLVWEGIIYGLQGNDAQAAGIFSTVKSRYSSEESFFLTRCQDYLVIGQNSKSEQDAQAAIAANPDSASGYYLLGSAQENTKDTQAALKSYQQAVELADQSGNASLSVEAKIKMGYLMQGAGGNLNSPQVTPTP